VRARDPNELAERAGVPTSYAPGRSRWRGWRPRLRCMRRGHLRRAMRKAASRETTRPRLCL